MYFWITRRHQKNWYVFERGIQQADKDVTIFVEHEPYKGDMKPQFSF